MPTPAPMAQTARALVPLKERKTHLDEGLDLAALGELLRTHALGHLEGVALDAGDDGVGVWPLLGALIELLDDDDLLSRLAALEDDRDLADSRLRFLDMDIFVESRVKRTLPGL